MRARRLARGGVRLLLQPVGLGVVPPAPGLQDELGGVLNGGGAFLKAGEGVRRLRPWGWGGRLSHGAPVSLPRQSLITFVNKHLNKLNLEVTELETQVSGVLGWRTLRPALCPASTRPDPGWALWTNREHLVRPREAPLQPKQPWPQPCSLLSDLLSPAPGAPQIRGFDDRNFFSRSSGG